MIIFINSFLVIFKSSVFRHSVSSKSGRIKPSLSRQKFSSAFKIVEKKIIKRDDAVIFKNLSI